METPVRMLTRTAARRSRQGTDAGVPGGAHGASERSAGRHRLAAAALGVAVLGVAGLSAGCGSSEASGARSENGSSESGRYVKVVNVEVETVEPGAFTAYVRLTGAVEAYDDVVVSSEESGVLDRFYADKGARVKVGQPIARIDDDVLRAQVDEARATAQLARERYERQRQLWEDEGIGSEIAFLQTKYESQAAAARLAFLEARLERHTISSPIAGVLDERYVDAGELVVPGTPVARVLTIGRLKIVGGVPERFGPNVTKGGEAIITFDVLPEQVFEGTIDFVGSAVDVRNRTFPIEIVMRNPDGKVKPQMVANVRVATERLEQVIVVPQEVVLRTEDGYQLFVLARRDGELIAEPRDVRLGPSFENRIVVSSGLHAGDRVVVTGYQLVDPGDRVRVVNTEGGQ